MSPQISRLIAQFLMESKYTDATKELYRLNLTYWFTWIFAKGYALDAVGQEHVAEFLEAEHPKGKWSQSSKYIFSCVARAFYRWQHPGQEHPITRIRVRKAPIKPRPFYTEVQTDQLLDSFGESAIELRNKAIVSLAVETGLRASEICRLELADVRFTDLSLTVLVKGQRYEEAIFSPETAQYLQDWLYIRDRYAVDSRVKTMFIAIGGGVTGRPLTRHGLRAISYNITQAAGLDRGSPHRFRHSCANQLLENGASTLHVQMGLRLRDHSQVPRYTSGRNLNQLRKFLPRANTSGAVSAKKIFDPSRKPRLNLPTYSRPNQKGLRQPA